MTRSPNNPACDRAGIAVIAIMQIVATAKPYERQLRIEQLLRGEFADIEQQIAADRKGYADE
jgi:hypothetical protein